LICSQNKKDSIPQLSDLVTITKEKGKEPKMTVQAYPFGKEQEISEVSLVHQSNSSVPAPGKEYLPDIVIGYSSGENEILSLPFLKNRLIHFDEYKEAVLRNYSYSEPESSLIYIDSEMSQAVLLSILIFESEATLTPLKKELGIEGLRSFRINLNLHKLNDENENTYPILKQLEQKISELKKCATTWYVDDKVLWLDFYINDQTKKAFKNYFKDSISLFRLFQILYELNTRVVKESIKEEVYSSKGFYTDGKLPTGSPEQNVFFFLDFMILKNVKGENEPIELLLRNFSDGEHQFLHTMGICLMLKDRNCLLLLDEPETHFNPGWRAKFIKVLSDSLKAGGGNNMMKDILLSSHSPFIISDCLPNNVIFFEKDEATDKIGAKSVDQMGFNTYGTSIEIISDVLFKYNQTIGELSNEELENIDFNSIKTKEDVSEAKKLFHHLGDSIEKDLILARLNQLTEKTKSN
jgi:restriction system-associated AAA family ATPase